MTWNEFISIATKCGYQLKRHGKKHDVYFNPATGKTLVIERHGSQEIRSGLARRLLKELGL